MTQPSALSAELEKFIRARITLSSTQALSLSSSLERNLGLTGDDAAYFMEAYFEQFHVEVGDFNFPRYFVEESAPGSFLLLASLIFKPIRKRYEREPVTVAMLQRATDTGIWDSARLRIQ